MLESPTPSRPAGPDRAEYTEHAGAAAPLQTERAGTPEMQVESPPPVPGEARTAGIAIFGFVLSFTGLLSPVALVLCVLALIRVRREPDRYGGKGLAISGIFIAIAALALAAVFFWWIWRGYVAGASPPR